MRRQTETLLPTIRVPGSQVNSIISPSLIPTAAAAAGLDDEEERWVRRPSTGAIGASHRLSACSSSSRSRARNGEETMMVQARCDARCGEPCGRGGDVDVVVRRQRQRQGKSGDRNPARDRRIGVERERERKEGGRKETSAPGIKCFTGKDQSGKRDARVLSPFLSILRNQRTAEREAKN